MFKLKTIPLLLSSIVLSACGGSDGDGDHNQTSISSSSYVNGQFKLASETGLNFWQQDPQFHPVESGSCTDPSANRYYETDHVIVLGSESLPDDDFKWGATLAEKSLFNGLKAFNLSYDEYINLKSAATLNAVYEFNRLFDLIDFSSPSAPNNGADNFDALFSTYLTGSNGIIDWFDLKTLQADVNNHEIASQKFLNSFSLLSKEDQLQFINDLLDEKDVLDSFPRDRTYPLVIEQPEKLVLCLKNHGSMYGWGEGKRFGFEVSTKSAIQRSDDVQIATHEMIHHLQLSISSPAEGDILMERWFAEGQAVVLSGMSVAHGENGRNPLNVVTFNDVQNEYSSNPDEEYRDYGQAYNWMVNKFGQDSGDKILYGMRNDNDNIKYYDGAINSFLSFEEQFNNLIDSSCTYDCGYTLDQYRDDYPNQPK